MKQIAGMSQGHIFRTIACLLTIATSTVIVALLVKERLEVHYRNQNQLLREQRNKLSVNLNKLSKKAAILVCEKQKKTVLSVSNVGGWCEKPEQVKGNSYGHATDFPLAKGMSAFLAGKRVASFGDGRGHYKAHIDSLKKVKVYDAYDGGPFYDVVSRGKVKYLDLTIPQYGLPAYDWIISLEVAEHIPKEFESTYLDNIVRHAVEGIIISWAIPGQDGVQHINNQPFYYVAFALAKLGFTHRVTETQMLRKAASMIHLQHNVAVFRRDITSPIDMADL